MWMLGDGRTLETEHDPLGGVHRSRRLSDAETAQRMLQTGIDKVDREGLKVSFDLLRLEDLIVEAGVVRSAVYRRWPTKNYYYADLLRELAGRQYPVLATSGQSSINQVRALLAEHPSKFRTPEDRHRLIVEICRLGALENFNSIANSTEWNTYMTITATLSTLPSNEDLQSDLGEALKLSEQAHIENMAASYAELAQLLDYQLRPNLGDITFQTIAQMAAGVIQGLAMDSLADQSIGTQRFQADPFSTGTVSEWSMPAIGFTSVIMCFLEPLPDRRELTDAEIDNRIQSLQHM